MPASSTSVLSIGPAGKRLAIRNGARVDFVALEEIDWIEAANQYVRIHAAGTVYLLRQSLSRLEEELDSKQFVRIHRSSLVALDRIRTFESQGDGSGRVKLGGEEWLTVGRTHLAQLKALIGQ